MVLPQTIQINSSDKTLFILLQKTNKLLLLFCLFFQMASYFKVKDKIHHLWHSEYNVHDMTILSPYYLSHEA